MDKKIQDLKKNFDDIEVPSEVDMVIETAIKRGKRTQKSNFMRPLIATAACLCIMVTSIGVNRYLGKSNDIVVNRKSDEIASNKKSVAQVLPKVGSYENLQVLLKDFNVGSSIGEGGAVMTEGIKAMEKSASSSVNDTVNFDTSTITNYSNTNQQVKGVDEGDNVKNDGEYIYKITGNKVVIAKAIPAEKLEISSEITFEDSVIPTEMIIKGKYLIIIGGQGSSEIYNKDSVNGALIDYATNLKTQIRIFDISDKKNPYKVRSLEIDGTYSQSRMINSSVYIVSNKYINFEDDKFMDELPTYKDSLIGEKINSISYDSIGYCKESLEPNYIIIASLNLDNIKDNVNITTVLGSGNNIYASADNIYVAGYKGMGDNLVQEETAIYKFKLDKATTSFVTSGVVKGSLLNQFAMDESNGYFRVATTENGYDTKKAKNNLYVLNSEMKVVGKLEGLAVTERIYSTRFIGDRLYMVTFKQQDPLFVIDLKIPENPKVLGELKIPGFSNYLEPYDENHIMGFGQDTVDVDEGGNVLARPIGMKIAMFHVSDVTKPIEEFQVKVEGENSYSEVLNNHKALLFSKEKNLISFPVQYSIGSMGNYYQGVYVYNVSLKTGFTLKGSITHTDIKAVKDNPDLQWQAQIDRELYIGDNLYTISNFAIKANNLQTLKEISQLEIGNLK